jgi:hypothetical protein
MANKVNAKVLIDFQKYKYLLGLQPTQSKLEGEEEKRRDFSAAEDSDEEGTMEKSGIKENTSVQHLANVHNELLDNETKLQNIAQKNIKAENVTINAAMTKDEPKLAANLPVKAKFVAKRQPKPKSAPYVKKKPQKKYKEKQIVQNGEKWYCLK